MSQNILLTILNGDEKGRIVIAGPDSPVVVGRGEDAHIKLSARDQLVRRKHAYLRRTAPGWELAEIPPPKNTPLVNGVRQHCCVLTDGDVVQLGETSMRVSLVTRTGRLFRCIACGVDVSSVANSDGRALELADAAVYTCQDHVTKSADLAGKSIGKYELCSLLGQGGAGMVFRVYDRTTARMLALKRLTDLKSVERVRRFDAEMLALKELRHTNVIRFVDWGTDVEGFPFLVTEYAPGGNLGELASKWNFRLPPRLARDLLVAVLDGLRFVHSGDLASGRKPLIHRDIKPQNILLRMTGDDPNSLQYVPKIADFGLVKILHGVPITKPNEASGTIGYVAPEQVVNMRGVDARADIYSIGATLYTLLCGSLPIDLPGDDKPTEQLQRVLHADRIPIGRRAPDVPARLATVVDQACQRDAARRHASAAEFQQALSEAL
ncbi:MAG: FHA domain-containing serine/threonine-protein kinase [Bryobacteraceae bacterium]